MNLNDLILFAQSVDSGGFAPASRRFSIPKSTLIKRVAALETSLGVRLIERNSRSFHLTETGRDFYEHARAALIEVESAQQIVQRRLAEPSGTVRITAAVPVVQFLLAPHLPALARQWRRLLIQLHASDRFVDLVQEGFDIAVRSQFAPLPDSGLVQRKLTEEAVWLVAAPSLLKATGTPRKPVDLLKHSGLLTSPEALSWRLRRDDGATETVTVPPRMVADESVALLQAATAGLGITCLPQSICGHHVASGELVRVLPRWSAGTVATTALVPHRRSLLPSVRVVLDFLSTHMATTR